MAMGYGSTIQEAASVVRAGGVIAYPTEAVFGLGCDPWNEAALVRIASLKGRSQDMGFIIIAESFAQLRPFCQRVSGAVREKVLAHWPAPSTWVFPASAVCPPLLTGGRNTIALRVTAHPVAAALCKACGMALVSTSANLNGQAPLRSAAAVAETFSKSHPQGGIDCIVAGEVGGEDRPTSIRDAVSGRVIRR